MKKISWAVHSIVIRVVSRPLAIIRSQFGRITSSITTSPRRFYGFVILGLIVWYVSLFALPQPVVFAYGASTCTSRITFLPSLHEQSASENFLVHYTDAFSIGSWQLIATKVCFEPIAAPSTGITAVTTSPFGLPVLTHMFGIRVADAPRVLNDETVIPVAVTKPLTLPLTSHDETFTYAAQVDEKAQRCVVSQAELACRLDKLELQQGNEYTVSIVRSFAGEPIDTVSAASVKILPATHIVRSSIGAGTVIYDTPEHLLLETDKAVKSAFITMQYDADGLAKDVPIKYSIDDTQILVTWDEPLPREQSFQVMVSRVEGLDGSALADPYILRFDTSGGPKVQSVNIGSSGVALGTTVTVTFNQPLASGQSVATFASIAGGSATIYQRSETQISFRLTGVAACTAFTLKVTPGLVGANALAGTESWTFSSRTSCRVKTETIGHSVNNRSIQAYYYGAGSKTILFTGGIHGSEPSSVYLLQDWMSYLDANAYRLPPNTQIVVVPDVNPDGTATGQRHNARGVNLARNFPSLDWSTDIDSSEGILPGAGGTAPLSEPEAQALATLTRKLNPRLVMTYHARGSLVGINDVADSRSIGATYANLVGYGTMFDNAEAIMGYSFTGEYETWIGEELGRPAVLIELPGYHGRYFSSHVDALWRMVRS